MDDRILALDPAILHTADDIAGILRVDVVTVRRLISRGDLAAYRVGNEYRFSRADVEAYLRRHYLPARTPDTPVEDPEWEDTIEQFGRFTPKARQTLIGAREEAMRFNHTHIGTEHLLLGLTYEPQSVGVQVLARLGVDPPRIQSAVEFIITRGDRPVSGHIGLTPRAKKALSLATEEARTLGHTYVRPGHNSI